MKTAMFGGTFDPIHNGHVALVKCFADLLELDRVYIVPTKTPPHKATSQTPGEMRLEMCRLALEDDERLEACDIELNREGTSYTFYTVRTLMEQEPDVSRIYLITGADMFLTLTSWHRFDELKHLVVFCTVPRDDVSADELRTHAEFLESLDCRTFVADMALVRVSSTEVRRRAAEGLPLDDLVPPSVERYIIEHGLYRPKASEADTIEEENTAADSRIDMAGVNIDC